MIKNFYKKAQFAVEFIILISVMFVIFIGFFAVVSYRVSEAQDEEKTEVIMDIKKRINNEIDLARLSEDGYERIYKLPQKYFNENYTVQILNDTELVINYTDLEFVFFLPPNVQGNISKGWNMIQRIDGIIYMNGNIVVLFPEMVGPPEESIVTIGGIILMNNLDAVARFDYDGNLFISGTLTENTIPTPTPDDEFIIKGSGGVINLIINLVTGDLTIRGNVFENQATLNPSPSDDDYIFINNDGDIISYIDDNGNIYLKGEIVYIDPECDDNTDNDGDGQTDLSDSGCTDASDDDESDCGDSTCEGSEDCNNCVADCGPCPCVDGDSDGYGDPASVLCTHPELDCDDSNIDVNPGETELCNGVDDDCDTDIDEDFDLQTDENNCGSCGNVCGAEDFCEDANCVLNVTPYTVLLLHFDGPDDSTNDADFIDSSGKDHVVTQFGNTKLENTESRFGGTSAYFDNSGDYITIADSADWDFGTGDWTIDAWIYFQPDNEYHVLWMTGGENAVDGVMSGLNSLNGYYFQSHIDHIFSDGADQSGTWHHIAVTRSGDTTYHFIDGSLLGTMDVAGINMDNSYIPKIGEGYAGGAGDYIEGYIDELRVLKGAAKWTESFTPPTGPYE